MDFRLEYKPEQFRTTIKLTDKILLLGSCFTEHMFERFNHYKFSALQNPNGTLFNPISIHEVISDYINKNCIQEESLFICNSLWNHWNFHSTISHHKKGQALSQMQEAINTGHDFLKSADWLIITFGSAFVYEYEQKVVANCHKVPASSFHKKMIGPDQIAAVYYNLIERLNIFNPSLKIVFTVSPVRHLKDGFVENNRSKGSLLLAIEEIVKQHTNCIYFPSYELLIDDLRDYRFYSEDMVHPNYQATKYVWEKFSNAAIDGKSREVLKEIDLLKAAMQHKVMHPGSDEHLKFMKKYSSVASELHARFPDLDLKEELHYFNLI